MQFRDLQAQYAHLKPAIDAGIGEVLSSAHFIGGKQVGELEAALAEFTSRRHCITCANGTDALELALRALGIGEGDAVFVPSFTFMSTAEAVSIVGATPIFVDIDLSTFNISAQSLEAAISACGDMRAKAVIPVDLFGLPADFEAIELLAKKHGLAIIEDGAQGFGGKLHDRRACSFGEISTTSFFPAKPLGCYGDGGAIFTDNDELAALIRSLCVHGKGKMKYDNIRIGRNSRLDTLQAAVILAKLDAFRDEEIAAVNKAAEKYSAALAPLEPEILLPRIPEGFLSSWAQYTILCADSAARDALQSALKAADIPSMIYYPRGLHEQGAFSGGAAKSPVSLENTEAAAKRVLSLPMHPYISDADIERVVNAIKNALN